MQDWRRCHPTCTAWFSFSSVASGTPAPKPQANSITPAPRWGPGGLPWWDRNASCHHLCLIPRGPQPLPCRRYRWRGPEWSRALTCFILQRCNVGWAGLDWVHGVEQSRAIDHKEKVYVREEQKVGSQSGGSGAGLSWHVPSPPSTHSSLHYAASHQDFRLMGGGGSGTLPHVAELGVHEGTL